MAKEKEIKKETVDVSAPQKQDDFPASVSVVKDKYNVPVFQLIAVGQEARVYGKNGEPVSPVLSFQDASLLCNRFNTRDAEQIAARNAKPSKFANPLANEANQ